MKGKQLNRSVVAIICRESLHALGVEVQRRLAYGLRQAVFRLCSTPVSPHAFVIDVIAASDAKYCLRWFDQSGKSIAQDGQDFAQIAMQMVNQSRRELLQDFEVVTGADRPADLTGKRD